MIAFLTLLLGLTAGVHEVALSVDGGPVASVELRLDGEIVGVVEGAPWRADVDFGRGLQPHHLVAVALDADGEPVGHTEQWINLPRGRAEARWAIQRDAAGQVRSARLVWQSVEFSRPTSATVRFDGVEIPLQGDTVEIPPHDGSRVHLLGAELTFEDGDRARADAVFGGTYGERAETELTAVALQVPRRRQLRAVKQAEGLLTLRGEPVRIAAVDRGAADLFVVADRSALRELSRLRHGVVRRAGGHLRSHIELVHGTRQRAVEVVGVDYAHPVVHAGLRSGDRLFFTRPIAERVAAGDQVYDLFGISLPLEGADAGIAWQLTNTSVYHDREGTAQRLADAVARTAVFAAGTGRPRAVVLLLGPEWEDHSRFTPSQVRGFLRMLHVPLRVWYLEAAFDELTPEDRKQYWIEQEQAEAEAEARGEEPPSRDDRLARARCAWPELRDLASAAGLIRASNGLRRDADHQRLVWAEGHFLPQQLHLRSRDDDVSFAR